MVKPIGFSAFLKLLELSDGPRRAELKKKLGGGGGFQYWRPVQIVSPKAILPAADIELLKKEIDTFCSGHQRQYNKNAFAAFCIWIKGKAIKPIAALPTIDVPFGSSGLVVRLKPDISFELDGKFFSMNLWATTKPLLTVNTLSIGLLFCASAYKARGHENHRHVILDTISNRLFREEDILPNAIHLLKDRVDAFKKDWDALNLPPPASPDGPTDEPSIPKPH
jgi:hypothetical protein